MNFKSTESSTLLKSKFREINCIKYESINDGMIEWEKLDLYITNFNRLAQNSSKIRL